MSDPEMVLSFLEVQANDAARGLRNRWTEFGKTGGESPTWENFAAALGALDALLGVARTVRGEIEAMAAPLVPAVATAVEGVGLVEKHGSGKRESWRAADLGTEVAKVFGARLSDDPAVWTDPDSGEIVPPSEIVRRSVARTVEVIVQCCGMSPSKAWSSTALGALGITAKDFKTSDWAGYKVRVTPGIVDTTEGAGDGHDGE